MKSPVGIIAILVIIASAGWLIFYNKSQPVAGSAVQSMTPLYCTSCHKAYAKLAGDLPTKCHFCGEQTAWRAKKCVKCNEFVGWTQQSAFQTGGEAVKCEKCGSTKLREVRPDEIEKVE